MCFSKLRLIHCYNCSEFYLFIYLFIYSEPDGDGGEEVIVISDDEHDEDESAPVNDDDDDDDDNGGGDSLLLHKQSYGFLVRTRFVNLLCKL